MIEVDTAGLHPSTACCLEALQWLHERIDCKNILEIGCGNGILSVVAANIWDAHVLAADISPKAVADTAANIAQYGLESRLQVVRSDGLSHSAISEAAPYDLVIGNLLAELQARIALDIRNVTAPGGWVILSGILAWKALEIELSYTTLGFEIAQKIEKTPWITYLLSHNGHN